MGYGRETLGMQALGVASETSRRVVAREPTGLPLTVSTLDMQKPRVCPGAFTTHLFGAPSGFPS